MILFGLILGLFVLNIQPAFAEPVADETQSNRQVAHVINRLTFGAAPGDLAKVKKEGVNNFIARQLNPRSIAESPAVETQLQKTAAARLSSTEMAKRLFAYRQEKREAKKGSSPSSAQPFPAQTLSPEFLSPQLLTPRPPSPQFNMVGMENYVRKVDAAIIETRLVRAVESPRQLQEVMTDFWFNHFNISINKGLDRVLIGSYEEQAIRPYALGKFRDLVGATCHHPAMMFYLDNAQNSKAGFQGRGNKGGNKSGINENYARELMELHTLGVDGGYTQKDVEELARVLTGLGLPSKTAIVRGQNDGYWAFFNPRRHDFGSKVILGHTINGRGEKEIDEALDLLCSHPSTAHYISYKLAQYFVADNPPASLVDKLQRRFTETNGDIKEVLSTLFYSSEFSDPKYENNKFKSPYKYAVSVLRATDIGPANAKLVPQFLKMQGQPLYGCLTPDGYKNTKDAWLSPDGLLKRLNFATFMCTTNVRRVGDQLPTYEELLSTVNGGSLTPTTLSAVEKAPNAMKAAALMGSPEFMRY